MTYRCDIPSSACSRSNTFSVWHFTVHVQTARNRRFKLRIFEVRGGVVVGVRGGVVVGVRVGVRGGVGVRVRGAMAEARTAL